VARVARRRRVSATPEEVWELIADPYSLPRWWPRTTRVEAVDIAEDGSGGKWTKVLETAEGRSVRADYHRGSLEEGKLYAWEQDLQGTPFERHLQRSTVDIRLRPDDGGTEVTIAAEQTLRGLSRLGSPMMRRGQGAILDEALDGLERTLAGGAQ
jgi:uncharacterized protein YndB with AHSA1/START domain